MKPPNCKDKNSFFQGYSGFESYVEEANDDDKENLFNLINGLNLYRDGCVRCHSGFISMTTKYPLCVMDPEFENYVTENFNADVSQFPDCIQYGFASYYITCLQCKEGMILG